MNTLQKKLVEVAEQTIQVTNFDLKTIQVTIF